MVSQKRTICWEMLLLQNIPFDVPPRRKVAEMGISACIPPFELYRRVTDAAAKVLRVVMEERDCVPTRRHAETPIYRILTKRTGPPQNG